MIRKNYAGFTLMEILIVVAIIALIASMATLSWQRVINIAKEGVANAEMKQLSTAETWAHNDTGIFWSYKDLMSPTLPDRFAYDTASPWDGPLGPRLIDPPLNISLNTAQWHGPYLAETILKKVDAQGNPLDPWNQRYQLILLVDTSSTFMVNPTGIPVTVMVICYGKNMVPEYAIDTIDATQGIYRYRELTDAELNTRPVSQRQRDDLKLLF
ncbi:MAG: prepilin-type N-terminal cleavage/methylation domain-containing protein [bacterium]